MIYPNTPARDPLNGSEASQSMVPRLQLWIRTPLEGNRVI